MIAQISRPEHPLFGTQGDIVNIDEKHEKVRLHFLNGKKQWFSRRDIARVNKKEGSITLGYWQPVVEKVDLLDRLSQKK